MYQCNFLIYRIELRISGRAVPENDLDHDRTVEKLEAKKVSAALTIAMKWATNKHRDKSELRDRERNAVSARCRIAFYGRAGDRRKI